MEYIYICTWNICIHIASNLSHPNSQFLANSSNNDKYLWNGRDAGYRTIAAYNTHYHSYRRIEYCDCDTRRNLYNHFHSNSTSDDWIYFYFSTRWYECWSILE